MHLRTRASCFLLLITAGLTNSANAEPTAAADLSTAPYMSASAASQDIALARLALETLHAGYDRHAERHALDRMWSTLEASANEGITRGALYVELSRLLAAIRCDHTKAELPADMAQARKSAAVYLPFRFVLFDERMFVAMPGPNSGLARGDEITRIDGVAVTQWLAWIRPLIPVDGFADHVKDTVLEYDTEFMGGALDHFAPLVSEVTTTVVLDVVASDGPRQLRLDRLSYDDFLAMTGDQRFGTNFPDAIRFERLGDHAAYLAIDTFVNYRKPVDAMATLAPYFEQIATEGRRQLILDLRANGGGSDDAQAALLRHLISEPVQPVAAVWTRFAKIPVEVRPHLQTWEPAALDPDPNWFHPLDHGYYRLELPGAMATVTLPPAEHAFTGDLLVLTGPMNSSGTTHLLATLRTAGVGTLIGARTGGSPTGATAGILYSLTLPESGIRIRIPATRTVIANAAALPKDNGLEPDVAVAIDAESYFSGADAVLQTALEMIDAGRPGRL